MNKIVEIKDQLDNLTSAYMGLELLAMGNNGDSAHVGVILNILNASLEETIAQLSKQRKEAPTLRIIE